MTGIGLDGTEVKNLGDSPQRKETVWSNLVSQ